jgi:aminopeptidase N
MKEELLEGKKVTTYTAKLTRDFAFAVSDKYKTAEAVTSTGVTVRFYYYTEELNVDAVLEAAKRGIEYYEQTVGTYPFLNGNVCIAETDMFVSGVEFSKIVFMDSARLMQTQDYYNLTHQIGHQWFYNVVGSDQVNEPWLDEGLIMYVQERLGHATEEEYRAKLANDYDIYINTGEHTLADGIGAFENWAGYYNIHYTKAKLMFYALNRLMGDEAFWQCIRQYFQTYSFRIATGADFISTAEQVYGESLTNFFDEWLNGDVIP